MLYDRAFFDAIRPAAEASAGAIVPLVVDLLAPRSVLDVGCGDGTWLAAYFRAGVGDVFGVDVADVRECLRVPADRFAARDLTAPLDLGRRFDLVQSLEVAEHLPPSAAGGFVESLARHADAVLFSAAVPGQGGTGHLNEQWPEYWADLFQRAGFRPRDCVRPRVWGDPRVAWWYAQNALLFVRDGVRTEWVNRLPPPVRDGAALRRVHPRTYPATWDPAPTGAAADPRACVVLVPSGKVIDRGFEDALAELHRRGHPVRRVRQEVAPPGFRDRMAAEALAAGISELLWLDPTVVFDPADVEKLRARELPFVCGVYPANGWAALACQFPPGTARVRFGAGGGLVTVLTSGLGFALVRREVFEAVARKNLAGAQPVYFATPGAGSDPAGRMAEDMAFCQRARAAGFEVAADTSIRLWRVGRARLGWEDAGGERPRHADLTLRIAGAPDPTDETPAESAQSPPRNPLRGAAAPLPAGFPRLGMFVVTYPANAESLAATLASVRASDWGAEPVVLTQPEDWPVGRESGPRNYRRALEAVAADGCDFAVVLEDDVRVGAHLRHNLLSNPLVRRDQCDYLGLFIPDLIADPWERAEPHLGYRLARPRYAGLNALWARSRVWGSQAYLLSRRLVLAALERWDRTAVPQDARVLSTCAEFRLPLWYSAPCLVEHAPVVSSFGTPDARAPDFDPDFRLEVEPGFQPPEDVPGWLTRAEGELLWRTATGRTVLELATGGRSAVCLAQSAGRVVSVDADQSEVAEWVRRYGLSERVEFRRGAAAEVCRGLAGPFDLIFLDTPHDAASAARDIAVALPLLASGGLLAFHDYPDPARPDVRRVVDDYARRLGWTRTAQADFLGVFRT